MDDLFDIIKIIFLVTGLFILPIVGISYVWQRYECYSYGVVTGRETKFQGFTCYGKIDGVWYSPTEYRTIIVRNA